MRRTGLPLLFASLPLVGSASAEPQGKTLAPREESDALSSIVGRPHTVALFNAGIVALPGAPISNGHRGGDTPFGSFGKGDATLQTGIDLVFRPGLDWAIGAGFFFGPNPTSDDQYGGLTGLKRTHSRSYLFLGGDVRYFPLTLRWGEVWVGIATGGIIIADRFTTNDAPQIPTVLGVREVTLRTEGFALAAQAGFDWMFGERWVAGAKFRSDRWFLPNNPVCSPIGDCGTLTGLVVAYELGLSVGYRIPF